ncbi:hypothetical protein AMECASPLE_020339 [Ameca splendens]|uniref:Uncharacterized protein n=1 Tax=Ameca splendens TaxID=208324 RepID=A0ABV0XSI6_9TELE
MFYSSRRIYSWDKKEKISSALISTRAINNKDNKNNVSGSAALAISHNEKIFFVFMLRSHQQRASCVCGLGVFTMLKHRCVPVVLDVSDLRMSSHQRSENQGNLLIVLFLTAISPIKHISFHSMDLYTKQTCSQIEIVQYCVTVCSCNFDYVLYT